MERVRWLWPALQHAERVPHDHRVAVMEQTIEQGAKWS